MASKINYNNKAPFQTLEEIPDENKVNADDMNEIKTAVNNNADELDTAKEDIESLQNGQGTSNADITNLQNRVSTLETDNSTNKTDISSLKTEQEGQNNRLNILEEDNTTNKQDISNIKSEQTEQDKQIDMLINALPSETSEAENINLKGTIPVKFKEFKVSGNSKQETRSGKNLLYVPDQTVELNGFKVTVKDGKYTVEDNRETGIFVAIVLATNFTLKAGTYTISNGRNQNYPYVNLRSNGSAVGDSTMSGGDNGVKTITIAEDIVVDTIAIYAGTNTKITEIFPQLEEGTQATDYEPYGAMPSPEYPSEIQNVEGDVNVTVANKEKTEQQTVTFPLAQRQKLMLGDYLAEDGIHHKRKQIELDGTDFSLYSSQVAGRTIYMISAFSNNNNFKTYDSSILCNILKQGTSSQGNNYLNNNGSSGSLYVSIENSILGITDESTNEEKLQAFQNLIAETGFVYEGELAEEETEAYTPEQQEAYNQLKQLTAYEEETNIYSTNSTSPIFKVTAIKDINSVITQLNTVLLERS